jgi:hypothetical protein
MKTLQIGYAYLFFFFYNSVNKVKGNILVQFKALLMVAGIEFVIIIAIATYYMNFKRIMIPQDFDKLYLLIPILPLVGLKLWFFERNENWKRYISEFNTWPEDKQKKWNLIMRCIVIFVFANLFFSFYWMSQIDWSQYG